MSRKLACEPERHNGEAAPEKIEGAPKTFDEEASKKFEGTDDGPIRGERGPAIGQSGRPNNRGDCMTPSAPAVATAPASALRRGLRRRGGGGKGGRRGRSTTRGVGGASGGVGIGASGGRTAAGRRPRLVEGGRAGEGNRGKGVGGSTGGTGGGKSLIQRPTSSTVEDSTVPEGVV